MSSNFLCIVSVDESSQFESQSSFGIDVRVVAPVACRAVLCMLCAFEIWSHFHFRFKTRKISAETCDVLDKCTWRYRSPVVHVHVKVLCLCTRTHCPYFRKNQQAEKKKRTNPRCNLERLKSCQHRTHNFRQRDPLLSSILRWQRGEKGMFWVVCDETTEYMM